MSTAYPLGCRVDEAQANERFLELKPHVERHAHSVFRYLSPADREEAVAEAVAAAFQSLLSLTRRGHDPLQFPCLMAKRAAQHVQTGRRVGGKVSCQDAFCRASSRRKTARSLPQELAPWADELMDNMRTPVPEQVVFRIDYPRWLRTLSQRDRRVADYLALGHSTQTAAKRFGRSSARISQLRRQLSQSWETFHIESAQKGRRPAALVA